MANTATEIDWDCAVTKRHIEEAEAVGLTLIGVGINRYSRTYRFDDCGHEQEIDLGRVRENSFRCNQCLQDKLNEEAKAVGLTLIGAGRNKFYRTYRIDRCGHEQEAQPSSVRRGKKPICNQCQQDKLNEEAKAVGLTLIGTGRDYRYRVYHFDECGHEQEIRIDYVCKSTFKCNQCFQDKLDEEAKTAGLTLIGSGRNADYRTYRFDECGHEQEIQTTHVRNSNPQCNQCFQDKLVEEAKTAELTLIGSGRNVHYRTYRFNKCKHEQEIQLNHVRENNFICNTCEETARDLPSKVYLLKISVDTVIQSLSWLKLGYAKTVSARIKRYGLPSDAVIERLKVMDFETGRQARLYEASLHTKYFRKRLPIKKMKEFHISSGYNECYPLEMLDTLMKALEAKEKRMKKQQEK